MGGVDVTVTEQEIHEAAVACRATVLGDPPHYLFDVDQLAVFLAHWDEPSPELLPLPY